MSETIRYKKYTAYKPSGVELLGELPEHWNVKKIKYLLLQGKEGIKIGPFGSSLKLELISEEGYKIYGQENVIKNDFSAGYKYIDNKMFKELSVYQIFSGDIVITMMGTTGKSKIVPHDIEHGIMDSHLIRLRVDREQIDSTLLSLLINDSHYVLTQIQQLSKGTIMDGLNSSIIKSINIFVPPLPEQHAIADFLQTKTAIIDDLIAKKERQIELLKEKRTALINRAVTNGLNPDVPMKDSGIEWLGEVPEHWVILAIKWLTPVYRGASPRPIDNPIYFDDEGEYAWVRIADVSASDGSLKETPQRLSALGSSLSVKMEPGQIFVSIAGTVGKPCITEIKACIHDGFVYFPRLELDPKYLYRIFEAGTCYAGLGKWGTQLNLNTDTIGSIRIALPPEGEMKAILEFIDFETTRIDEMSTFVTQQIAKLREYRQTLITSAVTGKIDVRRESNAC